MPDVVIAGLGQTEIGAPRKTSSHYPALILGVFLATVLMMTSCAPKPAQPVLGDSFFSGQAFLDANGNGQLDPADTPLKDATFIVRLQGGGEFGGTTDGKGNAFVTIPGGVQYPVTLRMEPPKGSPLVLIGPAEIVAKDASATNAKFLFKSK